MDGKIVCICATCGRHTLMERSLRFFLDQDYEGFHTLLIYNNYHVPLALNKSIISETSNNKKVLLINNHIDSKTNAPYRTLGAIYNDVLKYISDDTDIIVHWDDDDIFLPDHLSEGVKGLTRVALDGKLAYKPKKSYFRHPGGRDLIENVLEPSIFTKASHIKQYGYSDETTAQHLQWVNPLVSGDLIVSDPDGKPTLIYNWGDSIPTFKTSGNPGNPENFNNYRNFSHDHGDEVLTPWSKDDVREYRI